MLGHTHVGAHVFVASHQHYPPAGLQGIVDGLGQGHIACHLNASHGRNVRFGQQVAVPFTDVVLVLFHGLGWQQRIERFLRHGTAHLASGQVAAQYRQASAHRLHHQRAIARPRPAFLVPLQGRLRFVFRCVRRQASGTGPTRRHLQH